MIFRSASDSIAREMKIAQLATRWRESPGLSSSSLSSSSRAVSISFLPLRRFYPFVHLFARPVALPPRSEPDTLVPLFPGDSVKSSTTPDGETKTFPTIFHARPDITSGASEHFENSATRGEHQYPRQAFHVFGTRT